MSRGTSAGAVYPTPISLGGTASGDAASARSALGIPDAITAGVAGQANRYTTLAALQAVTSTGSTAIAYVEGDGTNDGSYRANGSGGWARYSTATISSLDARAAADAARVAKESSNSLTWRVYRGSAGVLPQVTGYDADGVERIAHGIRSSDGAQMHYAPVDGPGFTDSVASVATPWIVGFRYIGAGPLYPYVQVGAQAAIYFDAEAGRLVAHDVLIRGDHGLSLMTTNPLRLGATGINGLISYGQSLSAGRLSNPPISLSQPYANLMPAGGVKSATGSDLIGFAALIEDTKNEGNSGTGVNGETPCSGAANYAVAYTAQTAGVAPSDFTVWSSAPGQSGQPIANLSKGTSAYARLMAQVSAGVSSAASLGRSFAVHAVSWTQGEADVLADTAAATYKAAVRQLVADLNTDIKAATGQTTSVHLLIYQTAWHSTLSGAEGVGAIALAQLELAATEPLIHLTTPIYHVATVSDHLHLTASGSSYYGHYIGRAYAQLVVEGREPDSIQPVSATAVGTTLRIRFDVPAPPLVFDTTNLSAITDYGFAVHDGTGTLTLSSPLIVNGDTVQWTLNRTLGTSPTVDYALSYAGTLHENGGAGNLRDSTPDTGIVDGVSMPLWHVAPHFRIPIHKLAE